MGFAQFVNITAMFNFKAEVKLQVAEGGDDDDDDDDYSDDDEFEDEEEDFAAAAKQKRGMSDEGST